MSVSNVSSASRSFVFPLSYAQKRLWFLQQLEPESPTYNTSVCLRLRGTLDRGALARSLGEIVRRHESLRTIFPIRDGEPVQQVEPARGMNLPVVDLSPLGEAEQVDAAHALRQQEATRPFDLGTDPLFRALIVQRSVRDHELILSMHHIVSDGWSKGILMSELEALYAAFRRGQPSPLPDPVIQYADYTMWQRESLRGAVVERQIEYWSKQLADVTPLELSSDYARSPAARRPGATLTFTLPDALSERLAALGRGEQATPFMVLLAAFQWLLGLYADQEDIAVGTAIANRHRRHTEDLVGFLVNTLVMRVDVGGQPTFRELIGRVQETAVEAYRHQDLPFERLVEELNPQRVLGRTPIFQVMFSVDSRRSTLPELPGLHVEEIETGDLPDAKFDLMLILEHTPRGLVGELQYAADLFAPESMRQLACHYERLLEAASAEPDVPLPALALVEDGSRILRDWNQTGSALPDRPVDELFDEQADLHPDAPAVIHGATRLTYRELQQRADRLAQELRFRGVGPEMRVGLCIERGPGLIVGQLGILKAGAAYVPLDPSYPPDRLEYMVRDAGASLVLAGGPFGARFRQASAEVVCLEDLEAQAIAPPPQQLARDARGHDLAYVMYTSGSTGTPKGTMIPHRAIVRLVVNTDYVELTTGDRIAQLSNASFDAATFEIWGALLHGATLVVIDKDTAVSPVELGRALQRERITVAFLTTALFNQTARDVRGAFSGLRALLFGGEAVDPRWVRDVLAGGGPERLLHVYGPTETTTFATWFWIRSLEPRQRTIPIGRPIANTRAYLLDAQLRPVPPGLPGEIYLGGAGVGRGYWARPDLTADRFVPDPFAHAPGERLYRTGDRARYGPDGAIEFIGRRDDQVKLRGYRIELAEIEALLAQHEAVKDAVVVMRDDGDKRLVGYLVGRTGAQLRPSEIRESLKRRLPDYMVPAALVVLDELPLTVNGKVNRRALPAPARDEHELSDYVPPRTELEAALCRIWAETLRVDRVGIADGFFDLGGHSLLAARVISRLRHDLGADLPLRAIFESPTVAGLAAAVDARLRQGASAAPIIPRVARDGTLPLSPAQARLWFLQQLDPQSGAYNVAFVLRLSGELDRAALAWSLGEITARHEILRTSFPARRGRPVQEIHVTWPVTVPLVDLSPLPAPMREEAAATLRQRAADEPFDLAEGVPWRVQLVRRGEQAHELLLTMHHAITDGWSEGILVGELRALYAAYRDRRSSPLPPLAMQYADYAAWQQSRLESGALTAEVEYWRRQLDAAPVTELPADRPRVQATRRPQQLRRLHVPAPVADALRHLGQAEGATLFMALLAGFWWLLGTYARQKDVAAGTVVANRGHVDTEGVIGFFVNTLVLRGNIGAVATFRQLLRHARDVALEAYAHQDVPFEKLVEDLAPDRDLGRTPFFQALLVLQNASTGSWELPGLRVEEAEVDLRDAKFDLCLTLGETGSGLEGRISYAADLFDADTIDQFARHYLAFLERVVARPDAPLHAIPVLDATEHRRMVVDWNRTADALTADGSIVECLAAVAHAHPGRIAVIHEGTPLTYGELDERANRLAHHLVERGLGHEVRAAICLERGLEWVVAVLAVWKAGGVYVPLDPAYPKPRLAFMLDDSKVELLVTDQAMLDELPPHPSAVCVDLEWEAIDRQPARAPSVRLEADALAYVMYTSGSTGRPKGVMIEHGAMLNHLWAKVTDLGLDDHDVVAQTASASFDISIWQLFAPLLVGARVDIVADEVAFDAFQLPAAAQAQGITVLETVPSLLAAMIEQQEADSADRLPLSGLRCLISNAEALPVALCRRWMALYPSVPLLNTYGATECADDVTHHRVARTQNHAAYESLGTPLPNLTVYVLDEQLEPVPFGVPGELYLGGRGVGRGYANRPDFSAERFVPDPFAGVPGQRLYRTGDLGRLRRNGSLEFVGRVDLQVKVRGHRVELGEIEDALLEHEGVSQAVVLLREDTPNDQRLIAYIVPSGSSEQAALSSQLPDFLGTRVPGYMVPASYVVLAAMPLTVNGKVDRDALPAPEANGDAAASIVGPRTELEGILCAIWAQLLRVGRVGIHDNFFRLGGHSLLATQVIARVRSTLEVDVALAAIFRSPTVAGFAQEIDRARTARQLPPIVAADRASFRTPALSR